MLETLTPIAVALGRGWVAAERARHRPDASPLAGADRAALAPFFAPATLDRARVRTIDRLDPPWTIAALARIGVPLPVEIDRVDGITFDDTVLLAGGDPGPARTALLFHEIVHVVQYDRLGVDGFLERYVAGWLAAGRSYREIPLEVDAYAMGARFAAAPGEPFDAEAEVEARILARREVA